MESLQQNKYLMIDYEEKVKIKLKILFTGKIAVISMKSIVEKKICLRKKRDLYQPEEMEFEDLTPKGKLRQRGQNLNLQSWSCICCGLVAKSCLLQPHRL